jgi:PAS domain S-box-containing protein
MRIALNGDGRTTAVRPDRRRPDTFAAHRRERRGRDTPYDKLLECVYDAVLIADSAGRIIDFNARAEEFFGIEAERLLGMIVTDLIAGADASLVETVQRNLDRHKYTVVEARCRRSDGSAFPAEIAVNRVNLDAPRQLCFFVRDVTVRQRAQQDLEDAVERLEALDRSRSEFVSNVSHELRTPLTSMIYAVSNMLRGVVGPLPEKAVQYLERLDADCRRLLATVNDILDLRQIENRTLTLSRSRVPLGPLVEGGVDGLRVQAEAKRIRLLVCPPERHSFVVCDPQKMERVILNLVGNAIKFTPAGGDVFVVVAADPEDAKLAVVKVSDTGLGIPPEALSRVTQRYFKVGDQPAGSGLGLAISKEIVELHGGTIEIVSPVPGQSAGTEVTVRLPVTDPPTVLAVSGEAEVREKVAKLCEERGYRAATAAEGGEALALVKQQRANAVVLDLALPDMSGVDVALLLRQDRKAARLPILAVAAGTMTRTQTEVLGSLGIPLLPRPWGEAELLARLAAAFLRGGAAGGLPERIRA